MVFRVRLFGSFGIRMIGDIPLSFNIPTGALRRSALLKPERRFLNPNTNSEIKMNPYVFRTDVSVSDQVTHDLHSVSFDDAIRECYRRFSGWGWPLGASFRIVYPRDCFFDLTIESSGVFVSLA